MAGYADLHGLSEEEQLALIKTAVSEGLTVGVFVDTMAKADRYLRKLGPGVHCFFKKADLIKGSVFLKLGPRPH